MTKEFVPYEQALELAELNFNEKCFGYYGLESKVHIEISSNLDTNLTRRDFYAAPTFSQAFRWFREKYDWQHSIEPTKDQHRFELGYNYWIWNHITGEEHHTMPKNRPSSDWEYETYEEAELECLRKLIEIVKQK